MMVIVMQSPKLHHPTIISVVVLALYVKGLQQRNDIVISIVIFFLLINNILIDEENRPITWRVYKEPGNQSLKVAP